MDSKSNQNNKEKILDAARRLIQEKGIASTTLGEIAKHAGIAKGTLYYYFPNKDDLLFELAEQQSDEYTERFVSLASQKMDYEKQLETMEEIIKELTSPGAGALIFHLILEGVSGNEALRKKFKSKYSEWSAKIKLGIERFDNKPSDPNMSDMVLSCLIGFIFHTVVSGEEIDSKKALNFILRGSADIADTDSS
jgi:AcrR family transcriptional regulator